MTNRVTRRQVLASAVGVCSIYISGCTSNAARVLSATDLQPPVYNDGEVVIEMRVDPGAKDVDDAEAAFHDVTAVAYTNDRTIVGQDAVGTVELNEEPSVTLHCSECPDYLTFTIGEHGCQYDTSISVWRVNPPESEDAYSGLEKKRCGDPELPIPDQ